MSSSDVMPTRRLALLGLIALAGCGFTPAYAPGGAGSRLRGKVQLPDPDGMDAYLLNDQLTARLGPATDARFDLTYAIRIAVAAQGITSEQITTRHALNGMLDFRLTERGTDQVVAEGAVNAFTSYSATGSTIATTAAEADARKRLMTMLADQLVTRLLGTVPAE